MPSSRQWHSRAGRGAGNGGTDTGWEAVTLGADKGYDTRDFVAECGNLEVTPQVAQNTERSMGIAIAEQTTRQPGYEIS